MLSKPKTNSDFKKYPCSFLTTAAKRCPKLKQLPANNKMLKTNIKIEKLIICTNVLNMIKHQLIRDLKEKERGEKS